MDYKRDYMTLDEYLVCIRDAYLKVYFNGDNERAKKEKWHPGDVASNLTMIIQSADSFWDMHQHIKRYPNDYTISVNTAEK